MPIAAIGIGLGTAIGGAATAGAMVYGAHKQSSAARKAGDQQARAIEQQLQFERENELRRREEYDRAEAERKAQWDAEQSRRAPYRAAADAILRRRMGQMGLELPPERQQPVYQPQPYPPSGGPVVQPAVPPRSSSLGDLARAPMRPHLRPMVEPTARPRTLGSLARTRTY